MSSRKLHRTLGLIMLLPMIGWAATGLVFHIKPGYDGAYEIPTVKTYPLTPTLTIEGNENWQEVRLLKTVLGAHLLVTTDAGARHLNPLTLEELPLPPEEQLQRLLEDAISTNPQRYGSIKTIVGNVAATSMGVTLILDWNTLKLSQRGTDTKIINLLYDIHYLRWTPWDGVNQIMSLAGLFFLVALTVLGLKIFFGIHRR